MPHTFNEIGFLLIKNKIKKSECHMSSIAKKLIAGNIIQLREAPI
jgi:hypothetical protein